MANIWLINVISEEGSDINGLIARIARR